MDFLEFISGSF